MNGRGTQPVRNSRQRRARIATVSALGLLAMVVSPTTAASFLEEPYPQPLEATVPDNPESPPTSTGERLPTEAGFSSDAELTRRFRSETDTSYWNEDRVLWGFDEVDFERLTDDEFHEYAAAQARFDLAAVGEDLTEWQHKRSHIAELHYFHTQVHSRPGFLDAEIDEQRGELVVWTKDDIRDLSIPAGAEVVQTAFSRAEMDEFVGTGRWINEIIGNRGLELQSTVETVDGLTLILQPSTEKGETDLLDVAELASDLTAEADNQSFKFTVLIGISERIHTVAEWCDTSRMRCDNPVGGIDFGSCTSGFVMDDPNTAARGISSAGHCGADTTFPVRGTATAYHGNSGQWTLSNPTLLDRHDRFLDLQVMTAPTNRSGALVPTYYRDSSNGNQAIISVIAPIKYQRVCIHGRNNTGRQCGRIWDADWDNLPHEQDAVRIKWDNGWATQGGHSGAPITGRTDSTQAISEHTDRITSGPFLNHSISYPANNFPTYMLNWSVETVSDVDEGRIDSFVARLYRNALHREPSVAEVNGWSNQIDAASDCRATAKWIMDFFLESAEMEAKYSLTSLSGRQARVHALYWAAFNRAPDLTGRNWWESQLTSEAQWTWAVDHFVHNSADTNVHLWSRVGTEWGPCS